MDIYEEYLKLSHLESELIRDREQGKIDAAQYFLNLEHIRLKLQDIKRVISNGDPTK